MSDETNESGDRRWLTHGPQFAWPKLYAALLFLLTVGVFYGPLGFEEIRLIWIPVGAAILLSIPLYFLLRSGDGRIQRRWERLRPGTRLALRRVGWGVKGAICVAGGVWFLTGPRGDRGPDTMETLAGMAILMFGVYCFARVFREASRDA